MQKKIFLSGTAIIAVAVVAAGSAFATFADNGNSQTFQLSRYALVAAEADAAMPALADGNSTTRKVVMRINTVTGETDILQFGVAGFDDPTITNASWAKVSGNNNAFNTGSGI